jgi:hypothetical protein
MAYSNAREDKLYTLLPADVRERDAAEGEPLRALLALVEAQADIVEGDIRQLGEDAFIETCEPWAIPYIGDLVGTTPLFDASRVLDAGTAAELFPDLEGPDLTPSLGLGARADVAKTIYYRRRKATPAMLEELARDVTGWSAHVVEFFEHCNWSQWIRNHVRHHAPVTPDLRSVDRMDRIGGAFDPTCHAPDLAPIGPLDGWHGVEKLGFFLWRLFDYPLRGATPRRLGLAGDFRYHFSPLGNDAPLFGHARPEGDAAALATEAHVPAPYRRARFFEALRGGADPELPFRIRLDGVEVPPDRIRCRNLSAWGQPGTDRVAVDPALGRLTLGPAIPPAALVEVDYHYGFPGDLGGGPYRRRAWRVRRDLGLDRLEVRADGGAAFATIGAALAAWAAAGGPPTLIEVGDSATYAEAIAFDVGPATGTTLVIEAADGERPHLRLAGPLTIDGDRPDFSVTLSGLLVEGRIEIAGQLGRLRLLHTTLVPGGSVAEPDPALPPPPPVPVEPSVTAAEVLAGAPANTELRLELAFSITGPLRIPRLAEGLFALDSIVDGLGEPAIEAPGGDPGPAAHVERTTIRGAARLRMIGLATEVIFDGPVTCQRLQTGCVRFSYVPPGSATPRRYRCQPDLAERRALDAAGPMLAPAAQAALRERVRRRVRPEYTSESFGDPAYLQVSLKAPAEIAAGAEDGSEMGAWSHLKQPQREANLRLRLKEYLPFGLEAGLVYET